MKYFFNHRDYERELRTVSANIDMILGKNREKEQELEKKFFPNSFACKRLRNVPKICKRYKSITQRQMGFVFYSNIRIYCLKSISLL